jgi:UDP-N-acetylmuramoyl-tripeptide--D-alanyl-D-alanine ligase
VLNLSHISHSTSGRWLVPPIDKELTVRVETDSRKDCQQACFVAFSGVSFDAHNFLEQVIDLKASALCVEEVPSIEILNKASDSNCAVLLVDDTIKAYQQMASECLKINSSCKVVGITGSSGKTSVKSILSSLLEAVSPNQVLSTVANTNNHIGVPQNLLRIKKDDKYAVLEMGTNNPGEIAVLAQCTPADIALITSIGDSHAGNFSGEDGILNEKADIIRHMKADGLAIIPYCNLKDLQRIGALEGRQIITFGAEDGADYQVIYEGGTLTGSKIKIFFKGQELIDSEISLSSSHQALNVAACCAVMDQLGIKPELFQQVLTVLQLPGMRMKVSEIAGVTWINDAYNANPQSVDAFMQWLSELSFSDSSVKYLVLGDMLELGEQSAEFHQALKDKLPSDWNIIAVGHYFSEALSDRATCFESSARVIEALQELKPGDVVALKGSRGMTLEKIQKHFEDK